MPRNDDEASRLQGTLDMLILKTLTRGAMHGYAITEFIHETSENLLRVEPRESFPESIEVGMRFEGETIGADQDGIYTVTDIAGGKVILDGNHPLAGMALKFAASVVAIRPASAAEIEYGTAEDARSVILRPLS